jgi:hypothetical protein
MSKAVIEILKDRCASSPNPFIVLDRTSALPYESARDPDCLI